MEAGCHTLDSIATDHIRQMLGGQGHPDKSSWVVLELQLIYHHHSRAAGAVVRFISFIRKSASAFSSFCTDHSIVGTLFVFGGETLETGSFTRGKVACTVESAWQRLAVALPGPAVLVVVMFESNFSSTLCYSLNKCVQVPEFISYSEF